MNYFFYVFYLFLLTTLFSCKRTTDTLTTDPQAKLSFSRESITFDTLFTSIGSVTQRLWVYNNNKHAVNISSIQLARLYSSSYKIIVNGEEQLLLNNFEVKGKDSMLVLVKVLIDPQNQSLPYLVDDSIVFVTNGNIQDVDLLAYGQDAFFFTNTNVACNTIWTNTKPYVITGNVTVPAGCTLTIDKGTRVRFHKAATLSIAGTLLAQGDKDSIITFRHDNLSGYYNDLPGQWGGIIFLAGSKNNTLAYTELKNATNTILLHSEPDADTIAELRLEHSVLKNASENILTATNSDVYAVNCLVNNSAGYLMNVSSGGNYYFDFCTFANYSQDFFRNAVSIRFSNGDASLSNDLTARFQNSIVWGDKTEELEFNKNGTNAFTLSSHYSILKTALSLTNSNTLFNQNPFFVSEFGKDFTLQASSPAVDSGMALPLISTDLTGETRDASPDRGCFEYLP